MGEVGTGKTTVCRALLEQVPPDVDVAMIFNPRLTSVELLAVVCDELRVAYPAGTTSLKVLVDALSQALLEAHGRGRRTVLIIDEAQNLSAEVLEEVRLLTNLETTREKLLQVILIGQPELAEILARQTCVSSRSGSPRAITCGHSPRRRRARTCSIGWRSRASGSRSSRRAPFASPTAWRTASRGGSTPSVTVPSSAPTPPGARASPRRSCARRRWKCSAGVRGADAWSPPQP